ncbi:MAG: 50S ribosomal protein L4 [Alphaproteobacteria bacterium]|jgi:large subunit ribosomal protein L4|nr:50S ribosomal protein L4 [Alphaproteobacteria bacterium]
MKIDVINLSNAKVKEIELDDSVFGGDVRKDIIARVVKWQLAKRRSGNHQAKTRAEVKHTTRKPFKQKGTGRARQGMTSVPNMRGGGVAFGPVTRDHSHKLPKKVRVMGLKSAISSKLKEGKLFIIENLNLDSNKTADLNKVLAKLGLKSTLFVDAVVVNDNFKMASSNLIGINVLPNIGLNVYDILKHDTLVLTEESVKGLVERLAGN